MSVKSEMAAMGYLAKVNPKQYKLIRIKTYYQLREKRVSSYSGCSMWCNFHSIHLKSKQ